MALSQQRIQQIWVQEGGDPKYAPLMSRIALRESGGRPKINNRGTNKNGTTDWGLYQVNDVWRKDPVVGPLFRTGQILTPQGATKAAIHILKTQGPKAWATYNAATDKQYLGGFKGGPASGPTTKTIPGVDRSGNRQALIAQYFANSHSPDALIGLATGLAQAKDTPAKTVSVAAPNVTATAPSDHRIGTFDGKQVAAWMVPALKWARANGWQGQITSGVRTRAQQAELYAHPQGYPVAKPGTSNHEIENGGAVDVNPASARQLANLMKRYPGKKLVWAPSVGLNDTVHFSATGH